MKITLVAATDANGFIADEQGNGDFSSPEDKADLRAYLRSALVDGFIAGRKTADEFGARLSYKPLYVLTRGAASDAANAMYFRDLAELERKAAARGMRLALLGGGQAYAHFLREKLVDEARITVENGVKFGGGIPLGFKEYEDEFEISGRSSLAPTTELFTYTRRKAKA